MKDTYWLLLGIFGFVALGAWISAFIAKHKIDRLRSEAAFRQRPKKEKNI